jgi:hypothetical protein
LLLRTDNLLDGKQSSLSAGRLLVIVLSSAGALMEILAQAESGSAIRPETVRLHRGIPKSCSRSPRNPQQAYGFRNFNNYTLRVRLLCS